MKRFINDVLPSRSIHRSKRGLYDHSSATFHPFIIVRCYYCGNVLISRSTHRTKVCTYCHKRVTLRNASVLAKASTAAEASELAKDLKVARPHEWSPW